jgi:hypothetical protein
VNRFGLAALSSLVVACAGPDPAVEGEPDVAPSEALAPCEPKCDGNAGLAGIRFVNASGAARRVYLNGAIVCTLDHGESCTASVPAHVESVVHVTDESEGIVCKSDATGTLAECVCMTVEILC